MLLIMAALAAIVALAQNPKAAGGANKWTQPRTPWGDPDLQGIWNNSTITEIERPAELSAKQVLTDAEAAALERKAAETRVDRPPKEGDPGTYNQFWFDRGTKVVPTKQTSLIVDPPDGRLPFKDRSSALVWRQKYGIYMSGQPAPEFTLGPDTLPNRDRCLMAANAAAPPMTAQGYNDAHEIVQTPSYVLIAVEMMDEARIVPVVANAAAAAKAHRPSALPRWTGDSVGWWEGDVFVIETVSIDPRQGGQSATPMSKDAKVVERFTRISDNELLYQTEVTDPAIYTRPWKTESSFERSAGRIWEYACHEGNNGMAGILSGVRKTERDEGSRK